MAHSVLPLTSLFNLPATTQVIMKAYQALVDVMVTFYREQYERLQQHYDVLKRVYRECRHELYQLRTAYERLEDYANEQEQRANALHDVIDLFINRHGRNVRRDLLDSFNEVAHELDIELDEFSDSGSEFSVAVMSD